MISILQFKVGGEYDYNITFDTGTEKRKIQTNDKPTGNLLSAVSSVVVTAIKYFRFESITAQFRQIIFSYPEHGPACFVLELTIKTKDNVFVKHILKTDKLPLAVEDIESSDINYQVRIEQNNMLIKNINALVEEIKLYATGAREQGEFPFEDAEKQNAGDDSALFEDDEEENDDELDIVAGNIGGSK
jgi:hypothetical protein